MSGLQLSLWQNEALQKWYTASPEARELKEMLIHQMRHAYKHDAAIRDRITKIAKYDGSPFDSPDTPPKEFVSGK